MGMFKITSEDISGLLCLGLLLGGWAVASAATQEPLPETILVKNVRLIDREGKTEDKTVNILIDKQRLKLVTRDEIPLEKADFAVDALNGILLGNLEIGEPASFLILGQDPRENFATLMDTDTHTQFALHEGKIVRNRLPAPDGSKLGVPRRAKWVAYTPPPFALPTSYQDPTKWNHWKSKAVNGVFVAAILLDRLRWTGQDETSRNQVGDLDTYEGGDIRAFRVGSVGTFNFPKPWVYTLFVTTSAFDRGYNSKQSDDLNIADARIDIPLLTDLSLSLGKQKEPISMERLSGLVHLPMSERASVSDAMMPARNVGAVLSGGLLERRMTWAGGIFNNWLDTSQSLDESDTQAVGRVTGLPFISEDESHLVHLGFGLRHTDAQEGLRYRVRSEFQQSPIFVDTGLLQADHALLYNLEAAWRLGPVMVSGEYNYNDLSAPQHGDPTFTGYHATLSWILTGEMRAYNRKSGLLRPVPIARTVTQGGWGAWEASCRYSNVDLTDGSVEGGEMDIFSLGLNAFLTPDFFASANYRHIILDRNGAKGHSDGLLFRLTLMLQ